MPVSKIAPHDAGEANAFVLRGDYWEIQYQGSSALVENSRGLRYIALLIQHALTAEGPLHATELVALATGSRQSPVELAGKDPLIDARAEQRMIKRLEEIAFERNTASARGDYACVAELDEEVDRITTELSGTRNPKARGRRSTFSDASEKARKAVGKAISEAISKLSAISEMQNLAQHLSTAMHKGQWLSYAGGIRWQVEFRPASAKKSSLRPAM